MPALDEVDPVPGSIVDAKLANPIEELDVTEQTRFQAHDTLHNLLPGAFVTQGRQPLSKTRRLTDFDHVCNL